MHDDFGLSTVRVAIVGLGYVGLPLAVEFGKQYDTIGFDINQKRIDELRAGRDSTFAVDSDELALASRLRYTADLAAIDDCTVYIVTVPTPIDSSKRPDLSLLVQASEAIGSVLKPGDVVIYESTVYPGCTEEVCVPILERVSGLEFVADTQVSTSALPGKEENMGEKVPAADLSDHVKPRTFSCGYSPERINPGDKVHGVTNILKITSGSTPETADFIDALYRSIVTAGTHRASSIMVAEAAKVIENTQRDLNIALVNDLAILFKKIGIDTLEVLEAAGTKWNFLPFRPGLVGGHCISVDPYYLTHKAQQVGHHPDVILAGRRTNDGMGAYVAGQVIHLMVQKGINPVHSKVLVLGLAFKENCPDIRNTRVVDMVDALTAYNAQVDLCDPWVDAAEAWQEYDLCLTATPERGAYDAVIIAVAHEEFRAMGAASIRAYGKAECVLYDVKCVLPRHAVDGRL